MKRNDADQDSPAGGRRKAPKVNKRDQVLNAAIELFETVGVARTSMADIADRVGIARMTLYRLFSDRSALIEAIVHDRFVGIIDAIRERITGYDRLEEAIVECTDFGLRLARSDALLIEILETERGQTMESLVLNNTAEVRDLYVEAWRPLFEAARASGELRTDLSNERLIDGILSIINPMLLRRDLSDDDKRGFLQDFLVPALFRK